MPITDVIVKPSSAVDLPSDDDVILVTETGKEPEAGGGQQPSIFLVTLGVGEAGGSNAGLFAPCQVQERDQKIHVPWVQNTGEVG